MPVKSAKKEPAIFRQVCELIPPHLVAKLAREHGVKSRAITPWSHTVSMLYAQFTHAIGLNDVCDALGGEPFCAGEYSRRKASESQRVVAC